MTLVITNIASICRRVLSTIDKQMTIASYKFMHTKFCTKFTNYNFCFIFNLKKKIIYFDIFLESKQGNINPETAHALLETAGAEKEEESESLVKQLLENDFGVEVFVEKFLQERKIMHLRKLKAEKMTDLMRNPALSNQGMGYNRPSSGFYPSPGNVPYPIHNSGNVPYPMGAVPMPMPGIYRPY